MAPPGHGISPMLPGHPNIPSPSTPNTARTKEHSGGKPENRKRRRSEEPAILRPSAGTRGEGKHEFVGPRLDGTAPFGRRGRGPHRREAETTAAAL